VSTTLIEVLIILALILANGLFAMAELALVSARKTRLEQAAHDGDKRALTALELAASPNRLLSSVQVGITLIGIFSGALAGATLTSDLSAWIGGVAWLAPYSNAIALIAVVLLITYFSLVIGELIPKRLALNNPERTAMSLAGPMKFLARLFHPLIHLLSLSTDLGLRLLRIRPNQEPAVTEEDIRTMIEQGTQSGVFEER
jgi:putative hemolysin